MHLDTLLERLYAAGIETVPLHGFVGVVVDDGEGRIYEVEGVDLREHDGGAYTVTLNVGPHPDQFGRDEN